MEMTPMLDRVINGIGFIVTGVRRGSKQTIILVVGGVFSLAGRVCLLGAESMRRCWNFLMGSWVLNAHGQDDELIEEAAQLRQQHAQVAPVQSQPPPPLVVQIELNELPVLPETREVLLSLRYRAADDAASKDLQGALRKQQEVLAALIQPYHLNA
jgi:hypothetical protein